MSCNVMRGVRKLPTFCGCLFLLASMTSGRLAADEPDAATRDAWQKLAQLGRGFVIWESNRTGHWRIWRREIDGSSLRQISPEEEGREHYCPHLSPDGTRLVYLSYPTGLDTYDHRPAEGMPLYVLSSEGGQPKLAAPRARDYYEDRAAVWFDNDRLAYIDGEGFTCELDLRSGKNTRLTASGKTGNAWGQSGFLVNATKTHATGGQPTFSLFDAAKSAVVPQNELGGCQPYFTHDGRWGFWMGGAGGPINRIDLRTRQVAPILALNDPRMPKERAYLYFPMVSSDGRFFTFAASPNQHDHFKSDYDIFIARLDPERIELIERPVRYSFDPKNDRFPDVFVARSTADVARRPDPPPAAKPQGGSATWPSNRDGLVYLFQTAEQPNLAPGADGQQRSFALAPRGRARINRHQALVLTGGAYAVQEADNAVLEACRRSGQLTIEAVIEPDDLKQNGPARIVTFSSSPGERNFTLGQQDDRLIFRLRTPATGLNGVQPEVSLCHIAAGQPQHVAVTYRPGEMVAYLNGSQVYRGGEVKGDFSNWSPHHLLVGDEWDGARDWGGALEGVAIFSRALSAEEVGRDAAEYLRLIKSRPAPQRIAVDAELVARSPLPTLDEIKPYRSALVVYKYRITGATPEALAGQSDVLVTHWALLDGRIEPIADWQPGTKTRLLLEPVERNPQLQRFVTKDEFDGEEDLARPRYYDAHP